MDANVVLSLKHLEAHNISRLLLVEELGEDVGALRVSLTPLLGLSVVELQAENTLSELVHDRAPEHDVDLGLLPAEEGVDVGQLAKVEAASVRTALLITRREGAEFAVPSLASLVARLVLLSSHWVGERGSRAIGISVDELADAVAEQLVARHMHLIRLDRVLSQQVALLLSGELNSAHGVATERVVQEDVLEALVVPNVVVVGNVDTKGAAIGSERDDVQGGEVGSQEGIFFHLTWPGQLWDNLLRVEHKLLELARFLFVDDGDPALVVGAGVLGIDVSLDPADVALDDRALVLNPSALRVFMSRDAAGSERFDVLLDHELLVVVGDVGKRLRKVAVHLTNVVFELAKFNLESLAPIAHRAGAVCVCRADSDQELRVASLEDTSVQDVQALGHSLSRQHELLGESQVSGGHVAREIGSDTTLLREVDLCVWSLVREDLSFDFVDNVLKRPFDGRTLHGGARVGAQDTPELLGA
mmetsp:Transcript_22285/g.27353  ORF Transcript_22285/g.27353 Transcript_22285/m.27353 type:complete len:474 (-) Transcript_22285:385-1806(-)